MDEGVRRNKRHMDRQRRVGNVFHERLQRAQQLLGNFAVIPARALDGLRQLLSDGPVDGRCDAMFFDHGAHQKGERGAERVLRRQTR